MTNHQEIQDVAVIGCGAAGMMAAIAAAETGASVTVYERNPFAGKKLRITGRPDGCTCEDFGNYVMETLTALK